MSDLIDIASKEVGFKEGKGNKTKYGQYTGTNGMAWCHAFVSWCAKQAGIGTSIVPKTASTTYGMQWYKNKGRFKLKGQYTPKRNDLVYFKTGASHVGIVEYVEGNTLHTIEGNTSDKVARRTYPLTYRTITGYGVVSSYVKNSAGVSSSGASSNNGNNSSSNSGGKTSNSNYDVEKELDYLRKVLAKTSKPTVTNKTSNNTYEIKSVSRNNNIKLDLILSHNKKLYGLPLEEGLTVTWERKNAPGRLEFKTIADGLMSHGDAIALKVNGKGFFYGFIFELKPSQDGTVSVIAYDQLRYLKNKDTYMYKKKTGSKLIKMIAKDYGLKTGTIVDTKHLVTRIDNDKTLFDIIDSNLEETSFTTDKIYTLYDDYGKLTLKTPWKVNVLIDKNTGQTYNYSSSIDGETYNQIKLAYENEKTGTLDVYISKSSKSINKWGLLQYYEKIEDPRVAKLKGKVLLQMYNKVARTLSVSSAFGHVNVRAGCLVPVLLNLYDIKVSSYMLVDKVVHKFECGSHLMDIELSGGGFDSSY